MILNKAHDAFFRGGSTQCTADIDRCIDPRDQPHSFPRCSLLYDAVLKFSVYAAVQHSFQFDKQRKSVSRVRWPKSVPRHGSSEPSVPASAMLGLTFAISWQ
jgi:hypothetical protein